MRLFADDCLIYKEVHSEADQKTLNDTLDAVSNWCAESKMEINQTKTVALRVTNKSKRVFHSDYTLCSTRLSTVNEIKYLGVTISNNLNWRAHLENICSVAERKLWYLRRKLRLASTSVKLAAYLTYIRPTLEYGSIVWDPSEIGLINMLERVQRRAARFILSKYSSTESVTEMLRSLQLPTLAERRQLARLKFLFLLSKNRLNINTTKYLTPHHGRNLRGINDYTYEVPQQRVNVYANSFFPKTIRQWNALPLPVVQCDSVENFEKRLKDFYSVNTV